MALDMKQQLTQKMTQQLVMTPQLQMAIKLLQLSQLELENLVWQELNENPVLEIEETNSEQEEERKIKGVSELTTKKDEKTFKEKRLKEEVENKLDWENYVREYSSYSPEFSYYDEDEERPSYENKPLKKETLSEHLIWQLNLSNMTDEEKRIATEIIYNLDDDGRFISSIEEISERTKVSAEFVENVLKKVQEFDPIGVAARDLKECLLIQARFLNLGYLVEYIITNHLANLEKKNYKAIAKDLNITIEDVIEAIRQIHELEPKPGRPFFSSGDIQYITPDIYVEKIGDEYVITLNDDGLPKLKISPFYQQIILNQNNEKEKEYIKNKLQSASWLIKSIEQRQRTIYKVTQSIVKFQREFLDKGIEYLKPLVLKDVAEDIGMHESTISRVTTNKYVHTPQGIFELKFFFNSKIESSHGGDTFSSESVKNIIKHLINNENGRKPLSDQDIVELLKKKNINIARRTVTKYREMLGILPSSKRKKLF